MRNNDDPMIHNVAWLDLDGAEGRQERQPGDPPPMQVILGWLGGRWLVREE